MKIAIMGLGNIARKMAYTVARTAGGECCAVGSRDIKKAEAFAAEYGFEKAYGSYEALARDPEVELVYIATPPSCHAENMRLCLDHGKHVLCEKPFTLNAAEAEEILALSRERGLLVAEAIWTRYLPIRQTIDEILKSGIIGKPVMLTANLGYPLMDVERLKSPELGGGGLLDLGVYPINFALMTFGSQIKRVQSVFSLMENGIDRQAAFSFLYEDGRIASLSYTMDALTDRQGVIMGERGYIICDNINNCPGVHVFGDVSGAGRYENEEIAYYPAPPQITGFEYELTAAMRAARAGAIACPEMPHEEILRVMRIMDDLRNL